MRILYFGDPAGGLTLLERGLTPVGVVHGRAGGKGRHRFVAQIRSLPRWQLPDLEDPRIIHELARLQPDLLVAAFYPQRRGRRVSYLSKKASEPSAAAFGRNGLMPHRSQML